MCGITGLINLRAPASIENYYPAHLLLRHRGVDDEGFFVLGQRGGQFLRGDDTIAQLASLPHIREVPSAEVVLGHRRLSIIDLSAGGHQPMATADGRYTMVYNGEIFNYMELRQELEGLGHRFESRSDSEVLLTAFVQWGLDCFRRFNGMWAVAIYDDDARRLVLARDRFGIKPLYYAHVGDTLYFGSEAKFLLPFLPALKLNEDRAIEYLVHSLVDHHAETLFAGVHQLRPAHFMVVDASGIRQEAFWALPERRTAPSLKEAIEELNALLESSIRLRLRSDVPLGALLSGGLDSTTIVCSVRRLLNEQSADNTFDFFSAVFEDEAFSERRYIEHTVAQTRMPVHWIYPDPEKLVDTLPQLLFHQEFPFRSLAVYSQWEIMRHVSQTPIVVLLNGQGSDEIFGGYTAHFYALIAEYLRRRRPGKAWREATALSRARELSLVQGLAGGLRQLLKASPLRGLIRSRPVPYLTRPYRAPEGWPRQTDIFRDALVRNLTYSALPEYLRYEDRNSMAFTLESRLPFMDYRLVEWAMALPAELKIEDAVSKRVLRKAVEPFIPRAVTERKDKMGFVSPQEKWQRDVLAAHLTSALLAAPDIFPFLDAAQVRSRYRQYQEGRHNDWAWVWRVACLTWWHQYWWKTP